MLLLVAGCTTAEGQLFIPLTNDTRDDSMRQDASTVDSLGCVVWEDSIATGESIDLGGVTALGSDVFLIAVIDDEVRLVHAQPSQGTALLSDVIGDSASVGTAALAASASGDALDIAFQNHALAGSWRIYLSALGVENPTVAWEQVVVASQGGSENIGPQLAAAGADRVVAFRQDRSVAVSRIDGTDEVSSAVLDARLPHPTILQVVATNAGALVLSSRNRVEVEYFDELGAHIVGEVLDATVGSSSTTANGVAIAHATGDTITLSTRLIDGTPQSDTALASVDGDVKELKLSGLVSPLALVWLQTNEGSELTLEYAQIESQQMTQRASRPAPSANSLRSITTPSGTSAFFVSSSDRDELRVVTFCP